ncbi:MAG TPA: ankyrin repeat domain-containing protein [Microscillaceae bacterium]|nr:ankyrin repeat domain-containing protein [Microscillaceae bacterium]
MSAGDWKDMLHAAETGDLALLKYHLDNDVNPNYQHPELLTTPLIVGIESGQEAIVRYLLENGADPNLKAGFSNDSPLKVAKSYKNKVIVKLIKQFLKK